MKYFGTVRQKIFDGKTWYPLLCIKFFYTPNFLKHWRDAQEIFRHCETKNFRRKILKLPPPPSPPLIHKHFFATGHFLFSETQIILYEIFRNCETKKFWQKIVIPPPPPLLSIKWFSLPEIFWNTDWFPGEVFSVLWDKKNFDKTVKLPPSLLENFRYQNSFETQKGSPTNFIGTVRQRFVNGA